MFEPSALEPPRFPNPRRDITGLLRVFLFVLVQMSWRAGPPDELWDCGRSRPSVPDTPSTQCIHMLWAIGAEPIICLSQGRLNHCGTTTPRRGVAGFFSSGHACC